MNFIQTEGGKRQRVNCRTEKGNTNRDRGSEVLATAVVGNTTIALVKCNGDVINVSIKDVNKFDYEGLTPISHAIHQKNIVAVRWLLNNGASFFVKNWDNTTPLHWASTSDQIAGLNGSNILQMLLDKVTNPELLLDKSLVREDTEPVPTVLSNIVAYCTPEHLQSALKIIKNDSVCMNGIFIDLRLVDDGEMTLFHTAANLGSFEKIITLLTWVSDNITDDNKKDIVAALERKDEEGRTVLDYVLSNDHLTEDHKLICVRKLVELGHNPKIQNEQGDDDSDDESLRVSQKILEFLDKIKIYDDMTIIYMRLNGVGLELRNLMIARKKMIAGYR